MWNKRNLNIWHSVGVILLSGTLGMRYLDDQKREGMHSVSFTSRLQNQTNCTDSTWVPSHIAPTSHPDTCQTVCFQTLSLLNV
jgi:hypothetical protein